MLLELIVLLLAIPTGLLIAWLARDELIAGRKYILTLLIVCGIGAVIARILNRDVASWTLLFMMIVGATSYYKRFDKRWAYIRKI